MKRKALKTSIITKSSSRYLKGSLLKIMVMSIFWQSEAVSNSGKVTPMHKFSDLHVLYYLLYQQVNLSFKP